MEKRDRKGRRSEGLGQLRIYVITRGESIQWGNERGWGALPYIPFFDSLGARPRFSSLTAYRHTCEIFPLEMSEAIRFAHRRDEKG